VERKSKKERREVFIPSLDICLAREEGQCVEELKTSTDSLNFSEIYATKRIISWRRRRIFLKKNI
jgi:hypothetical protein